jgi:hypothetical protein
VVLMSRGFETGHGPGLRDFTRTFVFVFLFSLLHFHLTFSLSTAMPHEDDVDPADSNPKKRKSPLSKPAQNSPVKADEDADLASLSSDEEDTKSLCKVRTAYAPRCLPALACFFFVSLREQALVLFKRIRSVSLCVEELTNCWP